VADNARRVPELEAGYRRMEALGFSRLSLAGALAVLEEAANGNGPRTPTGGSPICDFFSYPHGVFGTETHAGVILADDGNWDGLPAVPRPDVSGVYVRIPDGKALAVLSIVPTAAGAAVGVKAAVITVGGWTLRMWDPANPQEVPGIPEVPEAITAAAEQTGCPDAILLECLTIESAAFRLAGDWMLKGMGCSARFGAAGAAGRAAAGAGADEVREVVAAAFRHRGLAGRGGLN